MKTSAARNQDGVVALWIRAAVIEIPALGASHALRRRACAKKAHVCTPSHASTSTRANLTNRRRLRPSAPHERLLFVRQASSCGERCEWGERNVRVRRRSVSGARRSSSWFQEHAGAPRDALPPGEHIMPRSSGTASSTRTSASRLLPNGHRDVNQRVGKMPARWGRYKQDQRRRQRGLSRVRHRRRSLCIRG
jgi:hypothetical protein